MKIAIFSELYSPSIGGMEVRYKALSKAFIERGHEVSVYSIGHEKRLPSHEKNNGVIVFRYPITNNYKEPLIKSLKRSILPILLYSFWVSRIASSEKFDFIIYNQWPLLHVVFSPKKSRHKSAVDWCEIRNGKIYLFFQRFLPSFFRFNIAVSPSVRDHIEKVSGQSVYFLPSGIDRDLYVQSPRSQRSSILYLGRIAEHKNISLLIQAYELLRENGYQGNLLIAGEGSAFKEISALASSSRYSNFISLLGLVSNEEKVNLLGQCELLVIPSKREGFPNVVAEAMASGLPTVTAEYPENGTADIVSYYGCGLVSKPNAISLSETILAALGDWENLSAEAFRRSEELDWSSLVETFEEQILVKSKM
ncbi:MAG: glycosyltransferase family 4 protein [Thermosynechococcaceae cyanobacterium MS004]|nr:glycosyltransferase family 4 protein [Thermosynechococcaceae cyanobacterium MS004]